MGTGTRTQSGGRWHGRLGRRAPPCGPPGVAAIPTCHACQLPNTQEPDSWGAGGWAGGGFPAVGHLASPQPTLSCICAKNSPPGVQRHPKALLAVAPSSHMGLTPGYPPRAPVILSSSPVCAGGISTPLGTSSLGCRAGPGLPATHRCTLVTGLTPGVCARARHRAKCLPAMALLRRPGEPHRGRRQQRASPSSRHVHPCSAHVLRPALASYGQSGAPREGTRMKTPTGTALRPQRLTHTVLPMASAA